MTNERLRFTGASGATLSARLNRPDSDDVRACALFAHCFTCSKDLKAVVNIAEALTERGVAVLRFDFTGLGESEGEFADTTFSSNVDDLLAAAEFMAAGGMAPDIIIGHSLGGAAVLQAAGRIDSVRAVATIGSPFDPVHVKHLFADSLEDIEARGHARVSLAGRDFIVSREFVRDLDGHRMEETIAALRRPLLIFHSPVDRTVGIENAARIYEAARHPKSFVSLDDADHLLLDAADSRYVGSVLAAWAERYVAGYEEMSAVSASASEDSDLVVASTPGDAFRTEITAGPHTWIADEPLAAGGTDEGPTPYHFLSGALGACTGMTLKMYAERKGWPLEATSVQLRHERVHADDADRCDEREPRVDRIHREIRLVGDLDGAQRARLLEIADRCPVHRTLSAGMFIETVAP